MGADITTDPAKRETESDGSFKANLSIFRNFIEEGGQFAPEKDRYHLYVAYPCPYATRTLITRKLKGLEDIISITVLSPRVGKDGFAFDPASPYPGAEADPLYNFNYLRGLYLKANPDYSGRITIPVLWDKKTHTIVNNESAEIVRIFNTAFNALLPPDRAALDLYPAEHHAEIDALNEWVFESINNGVYKAGFAPNQEVYDAAVGKVFAALDRVEEILAASKSGYLIGDTLTVADIRTWVSAIRFDPAYVGQFKCNIRTIRGDYPAINAWMKRLYWTIPAFRESTNFDHIKQGYYWSVVSTNPNRIVPIGPLPNIEPL